MMHAELLVHYSKETQNLPLYVGLQLIKGMGCSSPFTIVNNAIGETLDRIYAGNVTRINMSGYTTIKYEFSVEGRTFN